MKCYGDSSLRSAMQHVRSPLNALQASREQQAEGLSYASEHLPEVPRVVVARVLRGWGVLRTGDQLNYDVEFEGRNSGWQLAGQYANWILLPLAILGAIRLPRASWRRWSVLLAGPVLFTLTSAATYGSVRVRTIAEPSVAIFAAFAIVHRSGGSRLLVGAA